MSVPKKTNKEEVKISEYEVKLDQADSIITKSWNILKKHWGKLLVFLLIYGCYKFVVAVSNSMDENKYPTEEVIQEQPTTKEFTKSPFEGLGEQTENTSQPVYGDQTESTEVSLVREYDLQQDDGSIEVIQVWSDGTETIKK